MTEKQYKKAHKAVYPIVVVLAAGGAAGYFIYKKK